MTVGEIGLIQKLKSTVMKPTNTIIALVISSFSITVSAQDMQSNDTSSQKAIVLSEKKQKINFFVVSKRKKGKLILQPVSMYCVQRSKVFGGQKIL